MKRFSSERFSPRARPWLVLWLLPYLLMSVAAVSHNHGLGGCETIAAPSALSVSAHAGHGHAAVAEAGCGLATAASATHDAFCLACNWTNWTAALLAASPSLFVSVAATFVFAALLQAPTRRALLRAAVRGPPRS